MSDFGIWGPNHHRLQKELRSTGLQLLVGGILRQVEVGEPPDLHSCQKCYNLLTTALVGFGPWDSGLSSIMAASSPGMQNRYGNITWPLLCQTDVRCRLEHTERLRRTLEREHAIASAKQQSLATPFNADRPWNSVWTAAVDDHSFWRRQFEEHALLIVTKDGTLNEVITGEAPIMPQPASSSSSLTGAETNAKRRKITRPGQPNKGVTANKIERTRILGSIDLASAGAQADEKGKETLSVSSP